MLDYLNRKTLRISCLESQSRKTKKFNVIFQSPASKRERCLLSSTWQKAPRKLRSCKLKKHHLTQSFFWGLQRWLRPHPQKWETPRPILSCSSDLVPILKLTRSKAKTSRLLQESFIKASSGLKHRAPFLKPQEQCARRPNARLRWRRPNRSVRCAQPHLQIRWKFLINNAKHWSHKSMAKQPKPNKFTSKMLKQCSTTQSAKRQWSKQRMRSHRMPKLNQRKTMLWSRWRKSWRGWGASCVYKLSAKIRAPRWWNTLVPAQLHKLK